MSEAPSPLPLGTGLLHREILDPLSRDPVPCVLTHRFDDVCFIRPLVLVAPWWLRPASVCHQPGGRGEYWNSWRLSGERMLRGLIQLLDVRESTFSARRIKRPARVPGVDAEPKRGQRFLHGALLAPYTWRPLPGCITQVRGGIVSFVALVEIVGQEHAVAPYGGHERSGRWQMPEDAYRRGLIAPIE